MKKLILLVLALSLCFMIGCKEVPKAINTPETQLTSIQLIEAVLNDEIKVNSRYSENKEIFQSFFLYEMTYPDSCNNDFGYSYIKNCTDVKYAIMDLNSDKVDEAIISVGDGQKFILFTHENKVYIESYTSQQINEIYTDGTFSFMYENASGRGKFNLSDNVCTLAELWRTEKEDTPYEENYIQDVVATKDELQKLKDTLSIQQIEFTAHNRYPLKEEVFLYQDDIESKENIVWSGGVAKKFAGGKGTKKSPFKIKNAKQLAFMAKCINSGKYNECYFELTKDIDLKESEWVPIGNIKNTFKGHFNGNGHIVTGMNIENAQRYKNETSRTVYYGYAGLFGVCENSNIYNLSITNSSISTQNVEEFDILFMGIVSAKTQNESTCLFKNIHISDCAIKPLRTDAFIKKGETYGDVMAIGGIIGMSEGETTIENVNADISVDTMDTNSSSCRYIGGLIGHAENIYNPQHSIDSINNVKIKNASVYLNTKLYYGGENCIGLLGNIVGYKGALNIVNAFSKIKINRSISERPQYYEPTFEAGFVAGKINYIKDNDFSIHIENMYGEVEVANYEEKIYKTSFTPYYIQDTWADFEKFFERNCQGCDKLPKNHGFDKKVWDLSNLEKPRIK